MKKLLRPVYPVLLSLIFVPFLSESGVEAESLAGSYLAANQAQYDKEYQAASEYYIRALAQDPNNLELIQNALLTNINTGNTKLMLALARRLEALEAESQLARFVLLAESFHKGDYSAANEVFVEGQKFNPLLDGLMQAWAYLGMGQMSDATALFEKMAENDPMKVFSDYHRALALAVVGDFEGSEKILAGKNDQPIRLGRGSLMAHIAILSQLERNEDALEMATVALNGSGDPQLLNMIERLSKGETLSYDFVTDARQGAAEVFLTLATVLAGEQNDPFGLIYSRLSEYLRPESVDAILLVADTLNAQGQYDLAVKNFNKVPADHPVFFNAELGRAEALQSAEKSDAAIEVLVDLTKTHGTIPTVFTSLGDALRRQSRFVEATEAYNSAIDLLPEPQPNHWFLYYARGITYEREGEWNMAEADFRLALRLSPEQPLVLNYLGYGLVEKRIKFEEAQKMIETAVLRRPNDGYITDSLGWVLYRIEKFEESVPHLERAVELLPVDPIINDHLGDAYWMVGRKLEAAFQWRRALSFEPEEKDAERIRNKLEIGLNQVLEIEAETTQSND